MRHTLKGDETENWRQEYYAAASAEAIRWPVGRSQGEPPWRVTFVKWEKSEGSGKSVILKDATRRTTRVLKGRPSGNRYLADSRAYLQCVEY